MHGKASRGRSNDRAYQPARATAPAHVRYAVVEIPIDMIDPDPDQPRRELGDLENLAASIQKIGLLEPILVRPIDRGRKYQVVFGERRLTAARLAGLDRVPAFTADGGEDEILLMQWVENSMRKDLHPLEEAIGLDRLRRVLGLSIRALADELDLKFGTVGETLRLLQLPPWLQEEAMKTPSVGKTILLEIAKEKDPDRQRRMWRNAKRGTTSRRIRGSRVRAPVQDPAGEPPATPPPSQEDILLAIMNAPPARVSEVLRAMLSDEMARLLCERLAEGNWAECDDSES